MSLRRKVWSQEVGNLIRCRVVEDFNNLCRQYEPRFAKALQDPGSAIARRLCKVLESVGLVMGAEGIVVSDQSKWASISMIERVSPRLPSTSNALESFHGHGNGQTPRRNDFLPSVIRVAAMMIRKTVSFRAALEHSFRLMVRKARRRAKLMDPMILASESAHYATTREHCGCGETCQFSAMYRMSCPCSHQYSIGAEKPRLPEVELDLGVAESTLVLHLDALERTEGAPFSDEQRMSWEDHAVRQIKRFSHSRKTREIRAFVQENFEVGTSFALGLPVSLFGVISEGISQFSQ